MGQLFLHLYYKWWIFQRPSTRGYKYAQESGAFLLPGRVQVGWVDLQIWGEKYAPSYGNFNEANEAFKHQICSFPAKFADTPLSQVQWHLAQKKFKQRCGSYQFPPNNHKSNPQHIWNVFHRLIQWVQAPIRPGLIAISWGLRLSNGQVGGLRGLCLELPGAVGFHNSTHSLYSLYIYNYTYIELHIYIYGGDPQVTMGFNTQSWSSMTTGWPHWMVRRKSSPNGCNVSAIFRLVNHCNLARHTHTYIYIIYTYIWYPLYYIYIL